MSETVLRITPLKSFRAAIGPQVIPDSAWRQAKVTLLFKYLLIHKGVAVPQGEILAQFWPNLELKAARHNFAVTLYALRRVLGGKKGSPGQSAASAGLTPAFLTSTMWKSSKSGRSWACIIRIHSIEGIPAERPVIRMESFVELLRIADEREKPIVLIQAATSAMIRYTYYVLDEENLYTYVTVEPLARSAREAVAGGLTVQS